MAEVHCYATAMQLFHQLNGCSCFLKFAAVYPLRILFFENY